MTSSERQLFPDRLGRNSVYYLCKVNLSMTMTMTKKMYSWCEDPRPKPL